MEQFKYDQIEKMYELFTLIAFKQTEGDDGLHSPLKNELSILVRKQLYHGSPKYKRMGLIGATKIIANVSTSSDSDLLSFSQISSQQHQVEEMKDVMDMFQSVKLACTRTPVCTFVLFIIL